MCFLKNPKYKLRPVLVALQVRHGAALHRAGGFGAAACGRILHASLSLSPPLSLSPAEPLCSLQEHVQPMTKANPKLYGIGPTGCPSLPFLVAGTRNDDPEDSVAWCNAGMKV